MPAPPLSPLPRRVRHVRKRYNLLLFVGGALVLLLFGFSQWQAAASLAALDELRQQAERVQRLDSLLIQLMDGENAVRGYLLSGNRAHLEPYKKTVANVQQTLEGIRRDLNPDQENNDALADLSGLVAIKLRSLDQAVARGIPGNETRSEGKRYTDRIRERILGMQARLAEQGQSSFERSTQHIKRTGWILTVLAGGALILMVQLLIVIERRFTLREQLAELLRNENQRLDALVRERTTELSDLASYLTNVRESEKARLARELHDELGALLTAAAMDADWIARQLDSAGLKPCRERLARLRESLDRGTALKRRIIDDLRPPLLEELGLVTTLEVLGSEFARGSEEKLTLDLPSADLGLAPTPALALFRIAQEALTNIRKHARAHQVRLSLRVVDDWLELEIEDDGIGFQSDSVGHLQHGLAGMKHRVQMCAGELRIASRPGAGTRLTARIPLPRPSSEATPQADAAFRT